MNYDIIGGPGYQNDIIGQRGGSREGGGARAFTRSFGGGARSFTRPSRDFSRGSSVIRHGGFRRDFARVHPRFSRVIDVSVPWWGVSPWWNWGGGGWPWAWNWGYVQPWYSYPGWQTYQATPRWQDDRVRRAYAEWRQAEAAGAEPAVVQQLKARFEGLLYS